MESSRTARSSQVQNPSTPTAIAAQTPAKKHKTSKKGTESTSSIEVAEEQTQIEQVQTTNFSQPSVIVSYPSIPFPKFDGNQEPLAFLETWSNMAKASLWPQNQWHVFIGQSLEGYPRRWFQTNLRTFSNWDQFKKNFLENFKAQSKRSIYFEMLTMKKSAEESIQNYLERLEKIAPQDQEFFDNKLLNAFIFGLPEPLRTTMMNKDFKNLAEAKLYAFKKRVSTVMEPTKEIVEAEQNIAKSSSNSLNKITNDSKDNYKPQNFFHRRGFGRDRGNRGRGNFQNNFNRPTQNFHQQSQNPSNLECTFCGKNNHLMIDCRFFKKLMEQKINAISNKELPQVQVKIENHTLFALVDTGATTSIISKRLTDQLKLPISSKIISNLTSADGHFLQVFGTSTVKLDIQDHQYEHTFDIIQSDWDIILGCDFISKYKAEIFVHRGFMTIHSNDDPIQVKFYTKPSKSSINVILESQPSQSATTRHQVESGLPSIEDSLPPAAESQLSPQSLDGSMHSSEHLGSSKPSRTSEPMAETCGKD